jgi:hypothetical protein
MMLAPSLLSAAFPKVSMAIAYSSDARIQRDGPLAAALPAPRDCVPKGQRPAIPSNETRSKGKESASSHASRRRKRPPVQRAP